MHRLYLRFYFALLVSLLVFAGATMLVGRTMRSQLEHSFSTMAQIVQNALPPPTSSPQEQQAALQRLTAATNATLVLLDADRRRIAGSSGPATATDTHADLDDDETLAGRKAQLALPDGRWLIAVIPHSRHYGHLLGFTSMLLLLALAVAVGAYPVVRKLARRLERLQRGVESLGAGDLAARVPVEGRDEVARLAESFNRSAARIETLVKANKSLLANASHELRTPLARIRMAVELMKEAADPKRKAGLDQDIADLDHLIDEILLASRLDAVATLEANEEIDLLALTAEEAACYDDIELTGESVTLHGDPRLLRRLLRNLLENAARHGRPPTAIQVSRTESGARLTVQDHGPGIPANQHERVFEPFFRQSPATDTPGTGLGLALVRQIARRHGGEARYMELPNGRGGFVVNLGASVQGGA